MAKHVNDEILEKLFACPDEVSLQEKNDIALHLENCALCRKHTAKLKQFYADLHKNLDSAPTGRDKEFTDKLLIHQRLALPEKNLSLQKRVDDALTTFVEIIEPYPKPLALRFINYIRTHPIRIASGLSIAAALFFGSLLIRPIFQDKNPSYARAKEEFLVVYNKDGEVLWKKHVGVAYDYDKFLGDKPDQSINNFVTTVDVDGDGMNEIIAIYGWCSQPLAEKANTMVCYNYNKEERWRYEFHRQIKFGSERFSDDFGFVIMSVGDFDKNGLIEVVAVASHYPYYPTAIIRFDARTGNVLDEYWHSGIISYGIETDLDRDGIDELIFIGTNNGFNQASLLVLDPRKMSGHAPAPVDYIPLDIQESREKYYILLPQTDLCKAERVKRNGVAHISITADSLLQVDTWEVQNDKSRPGIIYYFDVAMRCVRVDANDYFVKAHQQMAEKGNLLNKLDKKYYDELRENIRYWDGEKFVNTPTVNKKYFENL